MKFHDTATSKKDITQQLAILLDNLNYMQSFRGGNSRTHCEGNRSLALAKGYYAEINIRLDNTIYNLYMDGTI